MNSKLRDLLTADAEFTGINSGTAKGLVHDTGSDPRLPTGTNYCRCSVCGEYFGGVNGFERHRVNFTCVDPTTHGLVLNSRGYWVRQPPKITCIHGGGQVLGGIRPILEVCHR